MNQNFFEKVVRANLYLPFFNFLTIIRLSPFEKKTKNSPTYMRFIIVGLENPKKNIAISVSKYVYLKMNATTSSQVTGRFFKNYLLIP